MIAKHITQKVANDNYRNLADYIADTQKHNKKSSEKVLTSWYTGCLSENYQDAIREIEATQALNVKSRKEKTYHLLVSFRPEDEAKLTAEIYKKVELEFAKSLGFETHQRHCGVHKNTDNLHLHISYNMIDPVKFVRKEPFRDFSRLAKTCREMEQKYGLKIYQKGSEKDQTETQKSIETNVKTNVKAQTLEAHSGRESLYNYVARRKEKIMAAMEKSVSWSEFQAELLAMGLELKLSGNGLTFQDRFGRHRVKSSDIDRNLAKSKLEARWGPFVAASPELAARVKARESYSATPIQFGPERDNLFKMFQQEMETRKAALAAAKEEETQGFAASRQKWATKMKLIGRFAMTRADRDRLIYRLKTRQREEVAEIRAALAERRKAIRAAVPYTTWNKCLQHKAGQGDETALAILRSKKEAVQPETEPNINREDRPKIKEAVAKISSPEQKIIEAHGLSNPQRRALLAVARMRALLAREGLTEAGPETFRHKVDTKGTVIFYLKSGGTIRDAGREIHFSAQDREARELAKKLAAVKWGRRSVLDGATLKYAPQAEQRNEIAR